MRRLLREPLLQFLVLGAMLFAAYHLVGRQDVEAPEKILLFVRSCVWVSMPTTISQPAVIAFRAAGGGRRRACR